MKSLMNKARVVQNAYVVADLEAACRRLHRIYGIGPFIRVAHHDLLSSHFYREAAAEAIEISVAFVQSGDLNLELVQQHSAGPSAFTDLVPRGRDGFHHVAVYTDDYEAERDAFVSAGFPVASEFTVPFGARICYVDTSAVLGHMIELYPPVAREPIQSLFDATRLAAVDWDGISLIQDFVPES